MTAKVQTFGNVCVFTPALYGPVDGHSLVAELSGLFEELEKSEKILLLLIHIDFRRGLYNSDSTFLRNDSHRYIRSMQDLFSDFSKPVISIARGNLNQDLSQLAISADLCFASNDSTFLITSDVINAVSGVERRNPSAMIPEVTCRGSDSADDRLTEAGELVRRGIVNFALNDSDVLDAARELAAAISANAPLALKACKKAVGIGYPLSLTDGLRIETEEFAKIFGTRDMKEGTAAFLGKRSPRFTGN